MFARRMMLVSICLVNLLAVALPAAAQPVAASPVVAPAAMTPAEQEAFLRKAKIVRTRSAGKGITGTLRATLSDGTLTHDASIQMVDSFDQTFQSRTRPELNFRDSWRYNVAAYALDKMLQIGMIPATVSRPHNTKLASFTWWVDDVAMDEGQRLKDNKTPPDIQRWNEQMAIVRAFDQLIDNADRNLGNLLISSDWRVWMIDHSRAFTVNPTLRLDKNLTRIDRQLLDRIKALDETTLKAALGDYVDDMRVKGLLARRDLIVKHFAEMGAPALFDWQRP